MHEGWMLDQHLDDLNGPFSNHLKKLQLYLIDDSLSVKFNEHRGRRIHKEP